MQAFNAFTAIDRRHLLKPTFPKLDSRSLKQRSTLVVTAALAALALAGCANQPYRGDPYYGAPASNVPHYGGQPAPVPNYGNAPAPVPNYGSAPAPVMSNQPVALQYGRVNSIEPLRTEGNATGGGAAIGGILGGVLGNQFGKGDGRAVTTIAGVLGGAVLGNSVERNNNGGGKEVYRVTVRFDSGETRAFDYHQIGDIRVGDRVKFDGNQVYRQ
ncbi:MAG: 17 kDa surface antigen [Rhizobacter sp.]|nr:17 kDa surface antigen [Rhizobacter sp.]